MATIDELATRLTMYIQDDAERRSADDARFDALNEIVTCLAYAARDTVPAFDRAFILYLRAAERLAADSHLTEGEEIEKFRRRYEAAGQAPAQAPTPGASDGGEPPPGR